ncbi:MAG: tetratricopeptide repeat protein [Thermodesulfovibrionia bacterium]|nr:tetratricopeptide repeat protein [Thermodesulfovibrionia bacterium]
MRSLIIGGTSLIFIAFSDEVPGSKSSIELEGKVEAHHNLGIAYLVLNNRDLALKEYEILKDLDPEIAEKLLNQLYICFFSHLVKES